jgi:DNA-binding IclR family transcriptional regulator
VAASIGGHVLEAYNAARPTRRQSEIRTLGYAVDHGVEEAGRTAVAAPVANRHGRVLGCLMVSVPAIVAADELERLLNATTAFARMLNRVGQTAEVDFLAVAHPKGRTTANAAFGSD